MLTRSILVSFDCEFTGLRSRGIREEWEDTPDERYRKLRQVMCDWCDQAVLQINGYVTSSLVNQTKFLRMRHVPEGR